MTAMTPPLRGGQDEMKETGGVDEADQAIAIWRSMPISKKKLLAPGGWALAAFFMERKI